MPAIGRVGAWHELARGLTRGQWCIFGVPVAYDHADPTLAAQGPSAIRTSTPYFVQNAPSTVFDPLVGELVKLGETPVLDFGDITYNRRNDSSATLNQRIAAASRSIACAGGRPLAVGGEHWLTAPLLSGLLSCRQEVHVLHFDAHLDLDAPAFQPPSAPLRNSNVMSHVTALDGVLSLTQLGVRELSTVAWPTREDTTWRVYAPTALSEHSPTLALGLPRGAPVYLSIDIDVLDPSEAPEVGWPVPGGVSYQELSRTILAACREFDVVGADIVEVFGSRTSGANLAARAAGLLLAGIVSQSRVHAAR